MSYLSDTNQPIARRHINRSYLSYRQHYTHKMAQGMMLTWHPTTCISRIGPPTIQAQVRPSKWPASEPAFGPRAHLILRVSTLESHSTSLGINEPAPFWLFCDLRRRYRLLPSYQPWGGVSCSIILALFPTFLVLVWLTSGLLFLLWFWSDPMSFAWHEALFPLPFWAEIRFYWAILFFACDGIMRT